jgi:hypothetical protein
MIGHHRRLTGLVAAIAAVGVMAALPAGAAVASTTTGSVAHYTHTKLILTRSGDLAAGSIIRNPEGKLVRLPTEWSKMSISGLAKIGIRPSMSASSTGKAVDSYAPPSGHSIRPQTAERSSGLVSIGVVGSGRIVTSWYTSSYPIDYVCTFSVYWAPSSGSILDSGTEVCGGPGGTFYGYLTYPVEYSHNWTACNTWVNLSGKPCINVT